MRKSIAFGILTMTLAASAGNLLKNSTFGEDAPQYGAMPPKWQAENLSVWEYIDDDGIVIKEHVDGREMSARTCAHALECPAVRVEQFAQHAPRIDVQHCVHVVSSLLFLLICFNTLP